MSAARTGTPRPAGAHDSPSDGRIAPCEAETIAGQHHSMISRVRVANATGGGENRTAARTSGTTRCHRLHEEAGERTHGALYDAVPPPPDECPL